MFGLSGVVVLAVCHPDGTLVRFKPGTLELLAAPEQRLIIATVWCCQSDASHENRDSPVLSAI